MGNEEEGPLGYDCCTGNFSEHLLTFKVIDEGFVFVFGLFVFLGPRPRHMEVPRLGVQLELQWLAYARTTTIRDPSCVCNLHHSSWQRQIPNPLSEARDRTRILMDASQVR